MSKTCLKCGYTRTELDDDFDADKCPSCGRFYAKVAAFLAKQSSLSEVLVVDNTVENEPDFVEIVCQHCQTRHKLSKDKLPLQSVVKNCKGCGEPITILGRNSSPVESTNDLVVNSPIANVMTIDPSEATKRCDFCGEQVLAIAKKCKHCGELLDVVLRMATESNRAGVHQTVVVNAVGGGAVAESASVAQVQAPLLDPSKHYFPHLGHFIMTILTVGWWSIIWFLHYVCRDKRYWEN
jgi:hypothetical protein